ncbi:uncharacterized protein [Watersipora subatra]|uniref:uncharacterized protein n=1 Tax=Watersipora subatra TaxID=2589382 RepID=UPI00355B29A2
MSNENRLAFYGVVRLQVQLRDVKIEEVFVASKISKDAIIGMPFLVAHQCTMNFEQPIVTVWGRSLIFTNRQGQLLLGKVQMLHDVVVPARTDITVPCRVTTKNPCLLELIDSCPGGPLMANSLNRPGLKGGVTARCLNLTNHPYHLRAGSVVGSYTGVEDHQVDDEPPFSGPGPTLGGVEATPGVKVPAHLKDLYMSAKKNCQRLDQLARLEQLLVHYQHIFSRGDKGVFHTSQLQHSILLKEGTRPIRQPPYLLGPEKKAEAELQDAYLLSRIDDSLDALSGRRYFSKLDLVSGYWQVPLDAVAQEKSVFTTRFGLWK